MIYNEKVSNSLQYAFFYNDSTVVTKNGSLLKIIKIPAFCGGYHTSNNISIKIRSILQDAIYDSSCIFWISTVRKPTKIRKKFESTHDDDFADTLTKKHHNFVDLHNNLSTELYISILAKHAINKSKNLLYSPLANNEERLKQNFDNQLVNLSKVTDELLSALAKNNPLILDIDNGLLDSLFLLSYFEDKNNNEPLCDIIDISKTLSINTGLFFGYNAFELSRDKKKNLEQF